MPDDKFMADLPFKTPDDGSPAASQTLSCPACGHSFSCVAVATVPDEQRFTMKLTSDSTYFAAGLVGEAIEGMSKILENVALSLGTKACVFVADVTLKDHEILIEFLITAVR